MVAAATTQNSGMDRCGKEAETHTLDGNVRFILRLWGDLLDVHEEVNPGSERQASCHKVIGHLSDLSSWILGHVMCSLLPARQERHQETA